MAFPPRTKVEDGTERGRRLPRSTRRTLCALAEALFTPEGAAPDAERIAWLEAELDDLCARAGRQPWLVLTASLAAIEAAPPVVLRRALPFHRLPREERVRLLEALERTGLGLALLGAKAMLSIVWHEHPATEVEIGVREGQLTGRVGEAS